jgi:hypothetical protein
VAIKKGQSGSSSKPSCLTAECIQELKFTDTAVRAGYMPSEVSAEDTKPFSDSDVVRYCSEAIVYVAFLSRIKPLLKLVYLRLHLDEELTISQTTLKNA